MIINMTDEFLTGLEPIDSGNIELLNKTNKLLAAIKRGQGDDEVGEIVSYLDLFISEHFQSEEIILKEFCFPDFDSHKLQHHKFIDEFKKIRSRLNRDGVDFSISIDIMNMIINWLGEHVCEKDKDFAAYINRSPLEVSV